MSLFNQQLIEAKKKQYRLYLSIVALFLVGAVIVLTVILASRGSRIEIHPDDAAILSSVRINKGIAIVIGEILYSISKKTTITVSAEGFKPKTQILNNNDFGKLISITLVPLPARIELTTNINNDKTNWLINTEVVKVSNTFEHELEAGSYQLMVSHRHYNDATLPLLLTRNEQYKQVIQLTPIKGKLSLKTIPSGANILINSIEMGLSPLNISLLGGFNNVTVMLDGYETINDNTIEISREKPSIHRVYRLELKKAVVNVSLKPNDGKLFLDNNPINKSNRIAVKAGTKHTLSYSKDGYFPERKSFNIAVGDALKLEFELKKEMGRIDIESSPPAEIELNGKPIGTTPQQLSLNAVAQKITLSKKGFINVTRIVTPSAAKSKKVSVILLSEKVAKLKQAPNQYTHKAGGKLKLFRPYDTFTMGAKRSELGQRANEFLRKIRLTKAFYAGVYEVTNGEYRRYNNNKQGDSESPVTSVSWIEAAGFCNWLSKQEGLMPVYQIDNKQLKVINANTDGYRLLTEAEWEWLARKSGKSVQSLFVWGNQRIIPKQAGNIADESAKGSVKTFVSKYNDGYPTVAPIGRFTKEKSGLYDQGGNVSEWTHDSYSLVLPKAGTVFQNPFDLKTASSHVIKGANWRSGSVTELRPSFREGAVKSRDDLGFRVGRYVYGGN